eukprot:CAMPEP_0185019610 /NCGR_PEP_ID=MMETSP1103-20130426/2225_1 /TAXON_ID=36769 /ORGANISM="Paraphysomonas bandaiensis, Strain Caron Lab Isolate" /LENGTH=382 /DNA_ID=CAMNT_0027550025 /DNA_START=248 /DNA_END=1396 /DNA_ORIENTATION=-
MEDAHISCTDLAAIDASLNGDNVSVFGVFDGHGGKEVAKFCQVYFLQELTALDEFYSRRFGDALRRCFHRMDEMLEDETYDYQLQQFRKIPNPSDEKPEAEAVESSDEDHKEGELTDRGVSSSPPPSAKKIPISEAMELFEKLLMQQKEAKKASNTQLAPLGETVHTNEESVDDMVRERKESVSGGVTLPHDGSMVCRLPDHRIAAGCTACVSLKHGNDLYVANAGDSRAVLCRGDGSAYALSFDHKPNDKTESDRIIAAGGFVNQVGRVNGNLNLSRAIGDLKYKQNRNIPPPEQIISGDPDITVTTLLPDDKFFLVACDGIWDCFTNQEACDFVSKRIDDGKELSAILEDIFKFCVSVDPRNTGGIGGDNMTCIIVRLNV